MSVLSINIVIPTAFHKHCCAGRPVRGKSALSVSHCTRPRTKAAQSGNALPSGTKRRASRRQRRPRIFGRGRPRRGVCRDAQSDVRSPARPRRLSHPAAKRPKAASRRRFLRAGFCFVQSIRRSHAAPPAQPSGVRSGIAPPLHLQFGICFARPSGVRKRNGPEVFRRANTATRRRLSCGRAGCQMQKKSLSSQRAHGTLFLLFLPISRKR